MINISKTHEYIQLLLASTIIFTLVLLLILKWKENKKLKNDLQNNKNNIEKVTLEYTSEIKIQETKLETKSRLRHSDDNRKTSEMNKIFFINKIAETLDDNIESNQTVNNKVEQLDKTTEISNLHNNETSTSFLGSISNYAQTIRKGDTNSKSKQSKDLGQILVSLDQKNNGQIEPKFENNSTEKNDIGQKATMNINNSSKSHESDNNNQKFSPLKVDVPENIRKKLQNVQNKYLPQKKQINIEQGKNLLNKLQNPEIYMSPRGFDQESPTRDLNELGQINFDGKNSISNSMRDSNFTTFGNANTIRSNDVYRLEFTKNNLSIK